MSRGAYVTTFFVGAMLGSAITWYFAKKKYEKIAQEEIDSVKEVFVKSRIKEDLKVGEAFHKGLIDGIRDGEKNGIKTKPDISEYAELVQKYGGIVEKGKEAVVKEKYPYVIPPEEFGEFDDYERISLTYYADGVLADDDGEVVDDVEDIVGDALSHFGEYEDDSVFVRCDERKCDYEILLDHRAFSEAIGLYPHPVEVV